MMIRIEDILIVLFTDGRSKVACILLGLYCCVASVKGQTLQERVEKAWEQYDYGQVCQLTGNLDSIGSECRELRLQACQALGKWDECEVLLRKRLQEDTTDVRTWVELAECRRRAGNFHDSSECYRRALALSPRAGYLRLCHVQNLLAASAYQEAKLACHDWLGQDSTSADAYRMLGQVYEEQDSLEFAFLGYRAAYRLDSLDARTVSRIANWFNDNEQYADALRVTENFRLNDTTDMDVNRQNAKAYCLLGKYPEAISRYEALKRAGDTSFLTYYFLGISYFGDNWFYGAYDNLKEALKQVPPSAANVGLLTYFARAASRTSWKDEGVEAMEEAVRLTLPSDTTMGRLYGMLAECYSYQNSWEKEIGALTAQYDYTHNNNILYAIGKCYMLLEDKNKAVAYFRRFMDSVPEGERYRYDENGNRTEFVTRYMDAQRRIKKMQEEQFFKGKP